MESSHIDPEEAGEACKLGGESGSIKGTSPPREVLRMPGAHQVNQGEHHNSDREKMSARSKFMGEEKIGDTRGEGKDQAAAALHHWKEKNAERVEKQS